MWASGPIEKHALIFEGTPPPGRRDLVRSADGEVAGTKRQRSLEPRAARRSCSVRASGSNTHVFNMRHLERRKVMRCNRYH
jgi:hypothetical protein